MVAKHFFPFNGAQEFYVYLPHNNDMWGGAPAPYKANFTVKGYLHILEPREGADTRPQNEYASPTSGGIYISAEFTTRYTYPTLPTGAGIVRVDDDRQQMFIIQNYVKQEVNPFTGWQPTKKYLTAHWAR